MAYTTRTLTPEVVELGSARIVDNVYKGDGATTFAKGDLIRIAADGQISNAAAANAGCVHGMVLQDWATAPTTSQFVTVLLFGADTVIKIQCDTATYTDFSIGARYELRDNAAGKWSLTTTTTQGVMAVVRYPTEDNPAQNADDILLNGCVYVSVPQAILDVVYAA